MPALKRDSKELNLAASGSLVFCTSQHNHAQPTLQKHKRKKQFEKKNSRLRTWRFVRLWPIVFKEEEYDGKI